MLENTALYCFKSDSKWDVKTNPSSLLSLFHQTSKDLMVSETRPEINEIDCWHI